MPITEQQRKKFDADLERARKGQKTETGMSEGQLKHMLESGTKTGKRKPKHKRGKKRRIARAFTD